MLGLTHLCFGLFLGVLFSDNPFLIACVVFGSLVPDIDYPFSLLGKIFQDLSFWIHENYGHRTITHSFILPTLFILFGLVLQNNALYFISLGILSHLLLDSLTNKGVMLLYPLRTHFIILDGKITTGSKEDKIIGIIFFLIFLFIIFLKIVHGFSFRTLNFFSRF